MNEKKKKVKRKKDSQSVNSKQWLRHSTRIHPAGRKMKSKVKSFTFESPEIRRRMKKKTRAFPQSIWINFVFFFMFNSSVSFICNYLCSVRRWPKNKRHSPHVHKKSSWKCSGFFYSYIIRFHRILAVDHDALIIIITLLDHIPSVSIG